jgi:beta-glucosidase/6-phospho-beta-glucosidase/beta-galactosidase
VTARPYVLATLEGYSVEGGFDRAHEPATCYSPTISLGRHAGPGEADGLWRDYERVLDVAATLPLDGVRLGLEWARIEPHRDQFDETALARYLEVVRYAKSLGLRVSVATVGEAWPAWLGLEAWLLPWVAPRVTNYVRRVVAALGPDVDGVVLFAEPEKIVRRGFLEGTAPPWRRRASLDAASASAQIQGLVEQLSLDAAVGPLMVERTCTIDLDEAALATSLAGDFTEVYLRALVKGKGPTCASNGLLVQHGSEWKVAPEQNALEALA